MKKYLYFIVFLFLMSCSKFFDVKPSTTNVNPTTISDFKEVLNTDSNASCNYLIVDISSDADSFTNLMTGVQNFPYAKAYQWRKKIWDDGQSDEMYNSSYSRILQMNVILDRINNATIDANSKEVDRGIVKSQAKINRAYYYWQLANIYGPAYQSSTASQDLTVPLITTTNANLLPKRANAADMYNFIISELLYAVSNPNLENMGIDIIHPGKASGFALLARTYLYMNKFDSAEIYADSALAIKRSLVDYNSYNVPTQLLSLSTNPEVYLGRFCNDESFYNVAYSSFYASGDYINLLTSSDQRLNLYFPYDRTIRWYGTYVLTNNSNLTFDYSISVPEMLLTKAECLSRRGQYSDAIALINTLREKRISSFSYSPIEDYNANNTDSIVLAERRKELSFHGGLRWFDLKRLNREGKYTTTLYRYDYDANYNVITTASLSPNSPNYVFPFSTLIINNNQNMVQNERE
ncbi:RagB/SusD family nutrient uptake outer membrane protein [Rhizosphaericola mali]|uniref:RagB/SusD family nutrient uptake outer membrane protein n=1 Tax=Rhizosphaericola mali TaxID=2545455 RepID=A0A5P2FZQ9_9BACT|nr:RagB/SusD family nutrient uptake outer membrane protein [Rhizosphaericola mali]QES89024.1 RagB/SusD family nutrient uptake outer membrane protein [Rhizosphaericola mali]